MADKPETDALIKKAFIITMLGAVLYCSAVFLYVM